MPRHRALSRPGGPRAADGEPAAAARRSRATASKRWPASPSARSARRSPASRSTWRCAKTARSVALGRVRRRRARGRPREAARCAHLRAPCGGARRFQLQPWPPPPNPKPTSPRCPTCRRRCSPRRSRSPRMSARTGSSRSRRDYSSDDDAIWNDLFARQMDVAARPRRERVHGRAAEAQPQPRRGARVRQAVAKTSAR